MSPPAPQPPERPDGPRIVLGAMSGTSADGVDVAAAEITGRGLGMAAKYLAHVEHPYSPELRRRIFAIRESGEARLDELAGLGREITLAYATAVRELLKQMSLDPRRVVGLAAHGQTLYHAPPDTIQWLDPALLAAQTDLAGISDFRRADLAAGGQGAPLVPFADWILFRHPEKTRVILNIGGIANLTYLPAGGRIEDVIAFDTGPGMCIGDWLMRKREPEGSGCDVGGRRALRGTSDRNVVKLVSADEYFYSEPPKSTDGPAMIRLFRLACRSAGRDLNDWALEDALATAAAVVAETISRRIWNPRGLGKRATDSFPQEVIASGGGVHHAAVVGFIRHILAHDTAPWEVADGLSHWFGGPRPATPEWRITDDLGLPSPAREAVAFAILGAATLDNEPSNVPSATGARRRVVLGSVTPRAGT